jgi:hypothetical protein
MVLGPSVSSRPGKGEQSQVAEVGNLMYSIELSLLKAE